MIIPGEDGNFLVKRDITCEWLWIYLEVISLLYAFYKNVPKKKWIIVLGLLPLLLAILL